MRQLTPMQAAYWVGREWSGPLGGVAAHLYAELDGAALDLERLQRALAALSEAHPMLKMRVDAEGRQSTEGAAPVLSIDDWTQREALAEALESKRQRWSHQKLDLSRGVAAFGVTLLPGGCARLHVDADMVAIDPSSFRIVIEELARLYEGAEAPPVPTYFEWLDRMSADPQLRHKREQDRLWWRTRVSELPPAPELPLSLTESAARSTRLSVWLGPEERRALQLAGRQRHLTTSTLMLGLFAVTLGRATRSSRFRLNVPMFWRAPYVEHVEQIVGDFSEVMILGVDILAEPLAASCRRVGEDLRDRLAHAAYSGVSVMRDLSRQRGSIQLSPVVFTSGLDMVGGDLFSERVARVFGALTWVISQGPQVALDAQVAAHDGGILINWDIRLDALPAAWTQELFDAYVSLVRNVATRPALLDA